MICYPAIEKRTSRPEIPFVPRRVREGNPRRGRSTRPPLKGYLNPFTTNYTGNPGDTLAAAEKGAPISSPPQKTAALGPHITNDLSSLPSSPHARKTHCAGGTDGKRPSLVAHRGQGP
jgi:hypothetical protein